VNNAVSVSLKPIDVLSFSSPTRACMALELAQICTLQSFIIDNLYISAATFFRASIVMADSRTSNML
jgi:hypothetical protein